MTRQPTERRLPRVVGLTGAVLLGLGAMLGSGVFVALGLATDLAGRWVALAIIVAALLALLNGLSSAQLAANHPVSGGTYAYGRRYLHPLVGFVAGWLFICAKSASAATAALGLAGYANMLFGFDVDVRLVAAPLVVGLTLLVAGGMQRSNRVNAIIVSLTLLALIAFVVAGLTTNPPVDTTDLAITTTAALTPPHILPAAALMFVAFTGYGRIATLGEEVRRPRDTIPRAVVVTITISTALYLAVAVVMLNLNGSPTDTAAPLAVAARRVAPWLAALVTIGACTALVSVLLNLLLGVSRVWLAMARHGDAPSALQLIHHASPANAVWLTGAGVLALVSVGSIGAAWSLSAVTVLIYYGITNLAALQLAPTERIYPTFVPGLGLVGCVGLAVWTTPATWLTAAGLLALGLVVRGLVRWRR